MEVKNQPNEFLTIPAAAAGSMHRADNEGDACGMGAIAHIKGERSHQVLQHAITSVCNMTHRGAVDADMKTGDGSGILSQLPYKILQKAAADLGHTSVKDEDLGVGVFFVPRDNSEAAAKVKTIAEATIIKRGIKILGWRDVPVNPDELGKIAQQSRPDIFHLLFERPEGLSADDYERQLYLCRRLIEKEIKAEQISGVYIPTLSHRLIGYKALAMPAALRAFYSDLSNPEFETAIALYHQRFSTNTFPAWPLGQPFRMMCHNGEINTVRGNRNWMKSREEFYESEIWGDDVEIVKDLIQEGESDSASLDHALELLVLSGRSLEHAMCMLVPPAFRNQREISEELRAFYQYHRSFCEPWDGPAGLVYTDGVKVCASLDRNGLRPSRFALDEDGLLYIGSEIGTIPMDDAKIVQKGRLGPGQMISADTTTGELRFDNEIKEELARRAPYHKWVNNHRVDLTEFVPSEPQADPIQHFDALKLSQFQVANGVTKEELQMAFRAMINGGQEAVYSMGDDTALSVLSLFPRNLSTYFKQLFAQVTNPPIDPIRERAVMTLAAGLGSERNLLGETPEHARILNLESAILFDHELAQIREMDGHGFKHADIDITWDIKEGAAGLEKAIDRVCAEAEAAVDAGQEILILTDVATSPERVAIPAMMATGAVHHHLNRVGKRMRGSLVLETAEVRDSHQLACVIGYGGTAVCPYLGYATVRDMVANADAHKVSGVELDKALTNYRYALEKGVLKIMSKMGISVLNSYQGAQIFEAVGVASEVIDKCFTGTHSKIGGVGFEQIAAESLTRHSEAYGTSEPAGGAPLPLQDHGVNRYQRGGEKHVVTPTVVKSFHSFVESGKEDEYEEYVKATLETRPTAIKDLLEYVPAASGPVPLEEVEPIENIRKRFTTAAMSLGALSPEAHEVLAIAMNMIGGKSDSGEGGEEVSRFTPYENGEWANSKIKQVASGRFGVTAHYLSSAEEIEIKMAQGAKPGEGGQLPAHKVNGIVAKLRRTQPGVQLISPPPHHDIYSIEDLAQLIHDLKEVNPRARITVKLVAGTGVGTIAAGVAKANADIILVSGADGGTAASPLTSIKHAGLPWEMGLSETNQTLLLNGLRDRITLRTDGGMRNGHDIVKAAILGAEEFNFGTIALIAMGCVYVRRCHLNDCPVGVATTDPKFRSKFRGTPEKVVNFFNAVAEEVRTIMAQLGVRKLDDLIGRPQFLQQREVKDNAKANSVDLSAILKDTADKDASRIWNGKPNLGIHEPSLDDKIIVDAKAALDNREKVELSYDVISTNRNLGTKLSGEVAVRYGDTGLEDGTIKINFKGSAGQSFGTFLAGGIDLHLTGEANDYVGKGMTAGSIVIRPADERGFIPEDNSIVGNTCLYGATGGALYANGRAGERFCVRNSGSTGIVEGCGDHGCEYMTNGLTVILGTTGTNFGAGMSGGEAYIYDEDGHFRDRVNREMIVVQPVDRIKFADKLRGLVEDHFNATGSPKAKRLLDDWETSLKQMVRVIPKTTAAAEEAEEQHESAGEPVGAAK
ncbi:glutamate synthase large subunit [Sulfuriroseicoccus oceanibius]|uniref:Glutamate synthase [NADPH] large chain n=1 Tax=Sulfuriroseicoccus oceanibius TaxID=2707525 RepID=A0A6B3LCN8_9BACT|nr:glutamate synthase large subunit [Sulfuriroseicoccus oceanibius]QQL45945.1 glutamate synthase large subunit [Sulfuriroseicoccus oceanibius]